MLAIKQVTLTIWSAFAMGMSVAFLVRRQCYAWRDELVLGEKAKLYRPLSNEDRMRVRQCNGKPRTAREPMPPDTCYGMRAYPEFLTREERDFLMTEIGTLMDKYGRHLTEDTRSLLRLELDGAGVESSFLDRIRFISDVYEDKRKPKGIWGAGDSIKSDLVPFVFRRLAGRIQEICPRTGLLRHIHVIHSPTGQFYIPPKLFHYFIGHDVYVIPLARKQREDLQGGQVVTISPKDRSRASDMKTVLEQSWTLHDQDFYIPFGSLGHIYATARLRSHWSVRPVQFFGHSSNPLPLDPETGVALYENVKPGTWGATDDDMKIQTPMDAVYQARQGASSWISTLFGRTNKPPQWDHQAATDVAQRQDTNPEAAFIILGFEGPIEGGKQEDGDVNKAQFNHRNKYRRWENYSYGAPPQPDEYDSGTEDQRAPMEAEVGGGPFDVPIWVLKNIFVIGRTG